jgi:hypothetical protein
VNLLGDNIDTIKKNTETLIDAGVEEVSMCEYLPHISSLLFYALDAVKIKRTEVSYWLDTMESALHVMLRLLCDCEVRGAVVATVRLWSPRCGLVWCAIVRLSCSFGGVVLGVSVEPATFPELWHQVHRLAPNWSEQRETRSPEAKLPCGRFPTLVRRLV